MLEIHEEIYARFMARHPKELLRQPSDFREGLRHRLQVWRDQIGTKAFQFLAHPDTPYDHAWAMIYQSTPLGRRQRKATYTVHIVAANFATKQMRQLRFEIRRDFIGRFLTTQNLSEILKSHSVEKLPSYVIDSALLKKEIPSVLSGYLQENLTKDIKVAASAVRSAVYSYYNGKGRKDFVQNTANAVEAIARDVLLARLNQDFEKISNFLDVTAQNQSKDIYSAKQAPHDAYQIVVYNHLIAGDKKYLKSRDYRYTALLQFKPLGDLFMGAPIWEDIDVGRPPLQVLGEHLKVKPSTLKHMARRQDIFSLHKGTAEKLAPYLDTVDMALWPQTTADAAAIHHIITTAKSYGGVFNRDPVQTVGLWAKERKQALRQSWHHLAFELLKEQLMGLRADPKELPVMYFPDVGKRVKINTRTFNLGESWDQLELIPVNMRRSNELWVTANEKFLRSIQNINHMKSDVVRRIVSPMFVLALEKKGYRFVDVSFLNKMLDKASERLWSAMPPADQIAASSYWHSPRIEIGRRFASVALNGTKFAEWPSIVPDQYKTENDIVVHPLLSATALTDEHHHMNHCIWSYSDRFYTQNYSMFSLRNDKGDRLSTLTIQDEFNEAGKRRVKFIENKRLDNQQPLPNAQKAAELLIGAINTGVIKPDWLAADAARADYKSRQIEGNAGYDFRNAATVGKVYDVYRACLPRRLTRTADQSFEKLMVGLKIEEQVDEFLRTFDFSQGGIIRVPQEPAALQIQP